jgi:hypothetical protein
LRRGTPAIMLEDMETDTHRRNLARRARYQATLAVLAVETNPRYQRNRQGRGESYCNVFVADATATLGVPIPMRTSLPDGSERWWGPNAMQDWLLAEGAAQWRQVAAEEAQRLANAGYPVVAIWKNPQGTGHVAMVRPGPEPIGPGGPRIAQAGTLNLHDTDVATGFGAARMPAVLYFAADRADG